MSVHILGQHNLALYKTLRVWAERGLIRIEDSRDNSYEIISVEEAARRCYAISELVRAFKEGRHHKAMREGLGWSWQDAEQCQTFIENVIKACKVAQEQGMPSDPTACRDLVRRRPCTVSVPEDVEI